MADKHRIEIVGPLDSRCLAVEAAVHRVVEDAHANCDVVLDVTPQRLFELGVVRTPAVVLDGRLVLAGRAPTTDEVLALLGVA